MPQTAACPDPSTIQKFSLGQLPPERVEAVAGHVLECPNCLRKLEALPGQDTLTDALASRSTADQQVPPIVEKLIARLKAIPQPKDPPALEATQGLPAAANSGLDDDLAGLLAPPEGPEEIGRLGIYRVQKLLGAGGMGAVFLAEDPHLGRPVALKVVRPAVAANPAAKQRFLREARACAALRSEHVITIYQVGEDRGVPFIAMEFLEGMPLDQFLERGRKPTLAQILRIGREVAKGLAAAHEKGLIHRDIKPANLWLDKHTGKVKILDFGLARTGGEEVNLTQSGTIVGTPAYMAPEQARAETVDGRCDLFSLGCVLYRLCAGTTPFKGQSTMAILMALAMETPRPVREIDPAIPAELSDLVARLLAKEPKDRPASAKDVVQAIVGIERTLSAASQTAVSAPVAPPAAPAAPPANPVPRQEVTVSAAPPAPPKAKPSAPASAPVKEPARPANKALVKATAKPAAAPAKGRNRLLIAAAVVFLGVGLLAAGWIIIRDKQGNEVARVKIPDGGSTEFVPDKDQKNDPSPVKPTPITPPPAGPVARSPFDDLKRDAIPAELLKSLGGSDAATSTPELVGAIDTLSKAQVRTIQVSPDGERFFLAIPVNAVNSPARSWRTRDLSEMPPVSKAQAHRAMLSQDGKRLVQQCSTFEGVTATDLDSGKEHNFGKAGGGNFTAFALSPDGQRLALGYKSASGQDLSIQVWNVDQGTVAFRPDLNLETNAAAFSPDGKRLIISDRNDLTLWDVATGKRTEGFQGAGAASPFLSFSPGEGRRLAIGKGQGAKIIDSATGTEQVALQINQAKGSVTALTFGPDGQSVAIGTKAAEVILFDATSGRETRRIRLAGPSIASLTYAPDGRHLLVGNSEGIVAILRLAEVPKPTLTPPPSGRSPFDELKRDAIPAEELKILADDPAKVAPELVAVIGSARFNQGSVFSIAFSPDGKTVSGVPFLGDDQLRLWDPATGWPVGALKVQARPPQNVRLAGLAYRPDGTEIALGTTFGEIILVNAKTGVPDRSLTTNKGFVRLLVYRADGKRLFSGSEQVKAWNPETGEELWSIPTTQPGTRLLTLSPDGKILAVAAEGAWNGAILLLDSETGRELRRLEGFKVERPSCVFLPNGGRLAVVGRPNVNGVPILDVASGEEVDKLPLNKVVYSVALSPDGKQLAGVTDQQLVVWDLADKKVVRQLDLVMNTDRVAAPLTYSPDGKWLVYGGKHGGVLTWDTTTWQSFWPGERPSGPVIAADVSRDGRWVVTAGADRMARVWDMVTGRQTRMIGPASDLKSIAVSPDGRYLATGKANELAVWNLATGEPHYKNNLASAASLAYSPDGSRILCAGNNYVLSILDAASGAQLLTGPKSTTSLACLAWSPDGRFVAGTSRFFDEVQVLDASTAKPVSLKMRPGQRAPYTGVTFSGDGKSLVLASPKRLAFFDLATGEEAHALTRDQQPGEFAFPTFRPDGRVLAYLVTNKSSNGATSTIQVLDAATRQQLQEIKVPGTSRVNSLFWTPDGRHLITANDSGTLYVFRLAEAPAAATGK